MIKVAIADDHSLVRQGLRRYLEMAEGIDAREVFRAALDAGVVVNAPNPETIRLLPPLTITADELAEGLELLRTSFGAAA